MSQEASLDESSLLPDPIQQLERWLQDATAAGQIEPTAMTLATVGAGGAPSARMVLFKGFHERGLTFYTNYNSRKGDELARNPHVALVFWWDRLERSVRIEGSVGKVNRTLSSEYFHSRPRVSQLSAAVSHQSKPVADRPTLEQRYADLERQLHGQIVPLPENWGGYRVEPARFEFWQGRRGRLHDRLVYLPSDQGHWRVERLEP